MPYLMLLFIMAMMMFQVAGCGKIKELMPDRPPPKVISSPQTQKQSVTVQKLSKSSGRKQPKKTEKIEKPPQKSSKQTKGTQSATEKKSTSKSTTKKAGKSKKQVNTKPVNVVKKPVRTKPVKGPTEPPVIPQPAPSDEKEEPVPLVDKSPGCPQKIREEGFCQ